MQLLLINFWVFSLYLLVDSSCSFWLVDSGRSYSWIRVITPIWRSLQDSSALERDLAHVAHLRRFPVCLNWYQSYNYFPMMARDDEQSSLFTRVGAVEERLGALDLTMDALV